MQISKEADYALRALLYLSQLKDEEYVATNKIADAQNIPPSFLAKIVARLSSAGIVRTRRGAQGGIGLACPGSEISMLQVIEAIDGPVRLIDCVVDPGWCPFSQTCKIRPVFYEAQAELVDRLHRTMFSDLIQSV